ncbi:flavocytochrome c [Cetobacterium sp.]|uniref:flavocytochrome c n=1 Tax=Cetobacterium sp. TaxID=2071632 RepID=UPI002FC720CD
MKKEFLSIGELSKKSSLSEKTIRYYSDINLIVPDYINPKTGYRYYKNYQLLKIKLIDSLKQKGFNLKEIQEHIKNSQNQNINLFFQNHQKKLEEINKKIDELKEIKKNILYSMEVLNINAHDKIAIKNFPKRNYISLDDNILSENILSTFQLLDTTIGNGYAHLGNVFFTNKENSVVDSPILIFQDKNNSSYDTIENGIFLTITYSENRELALKKMFDFALKNNLNLKKQFYEIELINFFMPQNNKSYIKEIQIPLEIQESKNLILKDGVYPSYGLGYNGEINLKVLICKNKIKKITILSHRETPIISAPAFEIIPKIIEQENSIYIPNTSGCSYTSKGIKSAVKDALISAGGDKNYLNFLFFKSNILPKIGWDKNQSKSSDSIFDVIIIGCGAAGLAASIEARKQGLSVAIFEKMPYIGGNTLLSLGTFIFPDFSNIKSVENLKTDLLSVGKGMNSVKLVDTFLKNLKNLENWLSEEINFKFENEGIFKFKINEYLQKKIPGRYGVELISRLNERALNLGVQIFTNSICKNLIYENKEVKGAIFEIKGIEKKIMANKRVILASGGFGNNLFLRQSFVKNLDSRYNCTNNSGNTGDGIIFSTKIGAKLSNMECVETIPFANYNSGELSHIGYAIYDGAILINKNGCRFAKENLNRNILSENILSQENQCAFIIWDSFLEKKFNYTKKFKDELFRITSINSFKSFNTIEEGCDFMEINSQNLKNTISNYNNYVINHEDLEFNRRNLNFKILIPPFYFLKISPSVHYTNGGILIDEHAQVLDDENIPIKKFFAAGEVTGGLHGASCLTGTAISDSLIFGIIAGQSILN